MTKVTFGQGEWVGKISYLHLPVTPLSLRFCGFLRHKIHQKNGPGKKHLFRAIFGFFSFCLFLGLLIKRSAFALGFLGLWQVIEGIFYGLMKWKLSDLIPFLSAEQVFQFFPLNAMGNLIKEPFSRLSAVQNIVDQIGEGFSKDYGISILNISIVLVWSALFLWWSYLLLKKRDL